jgi:hypothetical protein
VDCVGRVSSITFPRMLTTNTARLHLVLAAILFSTGGAAIKATTLTAWQVAGFRSGLAARALFLLLPDSRRGWTWRTLLVGVAYAATLLLFVVANKLTTSANTIFLQSTSPLYILILGPLLLHERIRSRDVLFMAAVGLGLALFFIERGHMANAAGEQHIRESDLEKPQEGDDHPVGRRGRHDGQCERERDQQHGEIAGHHRREGRSLVTMRTEPPKADDGERPGESAHGGQDVSEHGVGGRCERRLALDEEEGEAESHRRHEENVA